MKRPNIKTIFQILKALYLGEDVTIPPRKHRRLKFMFLFLVVIVIIFIFVGLFVAIIEGRSFIEIGEFHSQDQFISVNNTINVNLSFIGFSEEDSHKMIFRFDSIEFNNTPPICITSLHFEPFSSPNLKNSSFLYNEIQSPTTRFLNSESLENLVEFESFCVPEKPSKFMFANWTWNPLYLSSSFNGVVQKPDEDFNVPMIINQSNFPLIETEDIWGGVTGAQRFPLDRHETHFLVWLKTSNQDMPYIQPAVTLVFPPTGWSKSINFANAETLMSSTIAIPPSSPAGETQIVGQTEQFNATEVSIMLQRSIGKIFLTGVVLLAFTLFILLLLIIPDDGSALEVSVGLLLGLWGVREILIPADIEGTTIVHSAILFLYFLFAGVAFIRYLLLKPLINLFRDNHLPNTDNQIIVPPSIQRNSRKRMKRRD